MQKQTVRKKKVQGGKYASDSASLNVYRDYSLLLYAMIPMSASYTNKQ